MFREYIIVAGVILHLSLILAAVGLVAKIALELMFMKARGVKIVRKKRH